MVWPCRAWTGVDYWDEAARLRLAMAGTQDGEVDDSRRHRDPGWPWLDLPFPQPDLGATAPPRATGIPCLSYGYGFGANN
jgi:hypothetical protein